jgi:hypothetical protein
MKYFNIGAFLVGLFLLNSCGLVHHFQHTKKLDEGPVLGSLVVKEPSGAIETKGFPKISEFLQVKIQQREFTKSTFKKFKNSVGSESLEIEYIDSLDVKPIYHTIDLIDDIPYIRSLNNLENKDVYAFAKANSKLRVVTQVSLAFKEKKLDQDGAYFLEIGDTGNRIVGIGKDGTKKFININNALIFDQELSYFAWGKDNLGRIKLMDLVQQGMKCPSNLERKSYKLNKEKSLFKY